jgi:hypothetical protein
VNAFILVAHRPEDHAGIRHSAPVFGDQADAEPETDKVHNAFPPDAMARHKWAPSQPG